MGRKKSKKIRVTVIRTDDGTAWQGVLKFPEGGLERLEPFKPGTSRARALESTAAVAEELDAQGVRQKRRAVVGGEVDPAPMRAWVKLWNDERVRIQNLKSTADNLSHFNLHIGPLTGWQHVRDWTQDTMRKLSRALSEKISVSEISGKTAVNIWSTATQICSDATEHDDDEIRCREFDPSERVRGPKRGLKLDKQYLRPNELDRFVRCSKVPLLWRAVLAVAVYTYARDGELRVLRCGDVQVENGVISITKAWDRKNKVIGPPKGKRSRSVPIEPTLEPLLLALKTGRPDDELLFARFPSERDMSRGLKRWLRKAGIARDELLNKTPSTKPMTFHDARGTGITWRAVRNDPKFEIQIHAGHRRFSTTEEYLHLADAIRRGFGDPFQALPDALIQAASALADGKADRLTDR